MSPTQVRGPWLNVLRRTEVGGTQRGQDPGRRQRDTSMCWALSAAVRSWEGRMDPPLGPWPCLPGSQTCSQSQERRGFCCFKPPPQVVVTIGNDDLGSGWPRGHMLAGRGLDGGCPLGAGCSLEGACRRQPFPLRPPHLALSRRPGPWSYKPVRRSYLHGCGPLLGCRGGPAAKADNSQRQCFTSNQAFPLASSCWGPYKHGKLLL